MKNRSNCIIISFNLIIVGKFMELSIIIINWNTKDLLNKCLDSIARNSNDIKKEIFVVDNNSTDGSPDFIKENYPYVNLIKNTKNLGFSRANNIALRKAGGKYILLLNSDTVVEPSAVSLMMDFLEKHPEAGMAGPKLLNSDGTIQLACRRSIPNPKVAFYRITGLSRIFPKNEEFAKYNLTFRNSEELQEVEAISGACMMIKKKAMDEIGLLDEDFFMYGEDLDWCHRLGKMEWKIYYIPNARVIHHHRASSKKRRLKSILNFHHAMYIFYKKHFSNKKNSLMNFFVTIGIGLFAAFSLISNIFKDLGRENSK